MEIVSRGPLTLFEQDLSFDYEPRSVVSDVLGPMDRLPGLHVGQKWESKIDQSDLRSSRVGSGRSRASRPHQLGWRPGHRV